MAEQDVNVKMTVDTSAAQGSMRALQQEMSKLKGQLGSSLLTSQEKNAIVLRMGEIKGELADMKYAMANIDPGDTFGNVATAMRPVISGFGALTSAAVLFGGENKKLAEVQSKIMATIQITQALQEISDTKRIKSLYLMYGQSLKDLFVKKAETVATTEATVAQVGLNTAMATSPMGAIIAIISTLVIAYQTLSSFIGDNTEEIETNKKKNSEYISKIQEVTSELKKAELERKLIANEITQTEYDIMTGAIDAKDAMTAADKEYNDAYDAAVKKRNEITWGGKKTRIKADQEMNDAIDKADEIRTKKKQLISDIQDNITSKALKTEQENIDKSNKEKEDKQKAADEIKKQQLKESEKQLKIAIANQLKSETDKQLALLEIQKQEEDDNAKSEQEKTNILERYKILKQGILDKYKEKQKDIEKEVTDFTKKQFEERTTYTNEGIKEQAAIRRSEKEKEDQKEIDDEKYKKDTILDIKNQMYEIGLQMAFDFAKQESQAKLDKIQEEYDNEIKLLDKQKEQGLITEEQYNAKKEKLDEENKKKVAAEKLKQFRITQAETIAEIAMKTALAILQPVNTATIGALTPWFIALGAAQTAAVLAQKPPKYYAKGGVLNGPSHANGGILTSFGELEGGEMVVNRRQTSNNIDLLQSINNSNGDMISEMNNRLDRLIELTARPTKAYVVESEITQTQQRIKRIEANASI